ncbi:thioesterase II family protein [Janthinobacterium lividum]|uniref:thioesterase II family protein n=1 Tax=Janthinobacterium lividum TaxID=29581 RepID=UPI0008758284|nr:alpha/beta fold hydrolase [Janthinobacterium lividum]MCC7716667.1 thioesterase [Janthinobacterium lividum]OEZ64527.1 linear gramicidin dehydrogenase LgrE [Janthinobacterium lividum]WQE32009.1 alpha/beta fold hydrolase [Janthinobacterium lividum]STS86008.1 Linear gramicidin dehydrogenase LgrE [Janthinobacterium lividum]
MSNVGFSNWFHTPFEKHIEAGATAKLFCFPYAGAGTTSYHAFCKALPAHIIPFVAKLPGRETTRNQAPLTDIHDIVQQLTRAIRPCLGAEPVVFWGHSMGALVAFEVARLLGADLGPRQLIVSGHAAPHIPAPPRPISVDEMNDAHFVRMLESYNGMPSAILENSDLLKLILPQLRADFLALDCYRYVPGARLECDILCINGESDRLVKREQVLAWREETRGSFSCEWLPGSHFFINENRAALVRIIAEAIEDKRVGPGLNF